MIDTRVKELISAAMDGELNQAEQDELEQWLEKSPEARAYQANMDKMDTFLKQLPEQTVPHNLHAQMINAIDLPSPNIKSSKEKGWNFNLWPGFLRYGLATAAGLLVAVGVYEMTLLSTDDSDLTSMVGTVVPGNSTSVLIDTFSFDLDGVRNNINLERRGDTVAIDVELEAVQSLEVNFDFTKTSLSFDAVDQAQTNLDTLEFKGNRLRVAGHGQQHFTVFMHESSAASSGTQESIALEVIGVQVMGDGQLIQQGQLVLR